MTQKAKSLHHMAALTRAVKEAKQAGAEGLMITIGMEPWQADDAAWFRKNPRRSYRLRRIYADELGAGWDTDITHVLVRQLEPGLRDKTPIIAADATQWLEDFADNDTGLMVLWRELSSGNCVPVSVRKIASGVLQMMAVGSGVQQ